MSDVMASAAAPRLFLVHAPEDAWFVQGFLVPALGLPDGEILLSSRLELGSAIVGEIERGARSPLTVVVQSPAFVACPWARLAEQLAQHHLVERAAAAEATLLPALLADCELPLLSRFRVSLDFRDRGRWEEEAARLRARVAAPNATVPSAAAPPCPYPGMRAFTAAEAARFRGRAREVDEVIARLRRGEREIYVIGPSGSGKSSLVAAGVVPRLARAPAGGNGAFLVRTMRPGADPLGALDAALGATDETVAGDREGALAATIDRLLQASPGHDRVLLVVDQLEEVFTNAAPPERAELFDAIRALRAHDRVVSLLTLRADFYGALMDCPLWSVAGTGVSHLAVAPLRGPALREAVEAPARAVGVYLEPALVEQLLHDAASEPGTMPLLQETLALLWDRLAFQLLRRADYERMGDGAQTGLAITVARVADAALRGLSASRQAIARRVFLRLVQFGDGRADTRRQQSRAALASADDDAGELEAVIGHLIDHRLLTADGERVDLAHEILLAAWPRLQEWTGSRRIEEERRRLLEAKATEWTSRGRGDSGLLDDGELGELDGWFTAEIGREIGVSADVLALIDASRSAQAARIAAETERKRQADERVAGELARRRRDVKRARLVTAIAAIAAVAIGVLAVIAWQRSRTAEEQRQIARSQLARNHLANASELIMAGQGVRAVPHLVAAREAGRDDVALWTMFRWTAQLCPEMRVAHGSHVNDLAWSPDGTRIASAASDQAVRIWDARNGRAQSLPIEHSGGVVKMSWSPDGRSITTVTDEMVARVSDAVFGQALSTPFADEHASVMAWSPDGSLLAVASKEEGASIWDARTGQTLRLGFVPRGAIRVLAWSPDGTRLAIAGKETARIWDATAGTLLPPFEPPPFVLAVAWSLDGTRIATGGYDKTVRVWDARTGQALSQHQGAAETLAWSPDGERLATNSGDTAWVWDAHTGMEVSPPLKQEAFGAYVSAMAWSPDGAMVATSGGSTVRVWDSRSGQLQWPPLAHDSEVSAVAWSPDGSRLATASDKSVRVWQLHAPLSVGPFEQQDRVESIYWSPDGKRLATAMRDRVRTWDARNGQALSPSLSHDWEVSSVSWSADGARVATVSGQKALVWDAGTGELLSRVEHQATHAVAWSPDGDRIATVTSDGAFIRDARTGEVLLRVGDERPHLVAWSPDGKHLATVGHKTELWDAFTGKALAPALEHRDDIETVSWSPDGQWIATATGTETRIWDPGTGQALSPPLEGVSRGAAITWSQDGKQLATEADGILLPRNARPTGALSSLPEDQSSDRVGTWSPDGLRFATAGADNKVRVLDGRTGQALMPPLEHRTPVSALSWSPDGTRLATASEDHTLRIWDTSWDTGDLAAWRAVLRRCPYQLTDGGMLVPTELAVTADEPPPPR